MVIVIRSPSSRRAWIEIATVIWQHQAKHVALLAEGVDRNPLFSCRLRLFDRSPSSRRAWIEIKNSRSRQRTAIVALLAEGVDRNLTAASE